MSWLKPHRLTSPSVIKTAFQLGDGKVGTAFDISPLRRAQLAVVAHIRHNYTNYDRLLRTMDYNHARHQIEAETLAKIIEWRGAEDDAVADSRANEDLLKDVIVISEDEASDSETEEVRPLRHEQVRVEELPSSHYAARRSMSPTENARGFYYQNPAPVLRQHQPSATAVSYRQQSRQTAYTQAVQRYRDAIPISRTVYVPAPPVTYTRTLIPMDPNEAYSQTSTTQSRHEVLCFCS
jgi:hypothetical protein